MTFGSHWDNMENWVETTYVVICGGNKRGVKYAGSVWHSTNTLPTMVYGQSFSNIT